MAAAPQPPSSAPAPRPGGPGAPTRPCTSGRPRRPLRPRLPSPSAPRSDRPTPARRPMMSAPQPEYLTLAKIEAPFGAFLIATDHEGVLRAVDFWANEPRLRAQLRRQYGDAPVEHGQAPAPILTAFEDYFAGDIRALERVPVATVGTDFQQKVWAALQRIPAGQTWSYGRLAREIGEEGAARAVGL